MRWPTSKTQAMRPAYRIVVPVLAAWLAVWMVGSWAAIQDDALIHLRYANNLYLHHFITYDGIHPNYGASSLLYVAMLALLRGATASPQLPRAVSTVVHALLFGGLAFALEVRLPRQARVARLAGLVLLALLVTPSAVRWLEDGMETGLVVSVVTLLAWMIHERTPHSRLGAALLGLAASLAVLLRTELLLLCGVASLILLSERRGAAANRAANHHRSERRTSSEKLLNWEQPDSSGTPYGSLPVLLSESQPASFIGPIAALVTGSLAAVAVIFSAMHVLLPDTAVAKSHGIAHWLNPIHDTAVTLTGAFSFGLGMLAFWLLTLALVARRQGLSLRTVLANCFCPVVLALSSLRGQEIQGVRYFAWTFAFSIVWNILELAASTSWDSPAATDRGSVLLLYVFAGLLAFELPIESLAMHRVLTRRSETMRTFESQTLDVLSTRHGTASDIGYIGYFSKAEICDLAGLVNGRAAARLSSRQRVDTCARTNPQFLFVNSSQFASMAEAMPATGWKVCGQYDFTNVRTADRHYLIVQPDLVEQVCRATGRQPATLDTVMTVPLHPVAFHAASPAAE